MAKICIKKKATTKCEMDDFVRLHRKLYETASFYIN